MVSEESLSLLPGEEMVVEGRRDLAQGRETVASLLVSIGAPRLGRLGEPVAKLLDNYGMYYILRYIIHTNGVHAWHLASEKPLINAVLITHPHMDHIQNLSYVRADIPVWLSPETWAALKTINDSGIIMKHEILSFKDRETGERVRRKFSVFE